MNKVGLLVQKDLVYLWTSLRRLIFMGAVFSLFFPMGNVTFAFAIPSMMAYLLTYGVFSYEEKNKTHLLNASLPVNRRALCASKYLTGIIYILFSLVLTMIGMMVSLQLNPEQSFNYSFVAIVNLVGAVLGAALVYNAIILPLIIYFGALKMKYIIFMFYFASFALVGFLGSGSYTYQAQGIIVQGLSGVGGLMIAAASIIIYVISYLISISLFAQKEFK